MLKTTRRLALAALLALPAACGTLPVPTPVLSANDQTAIAQAQAYLNGLTQFTARFGQTSPSGYADGYVWLQRPGKLRVEYISPTPKLLLATKGWLLVADRSTGSRTTLPLSKTPLDILLAPTIQLSGAVTVTNVQRDPAGGLQIGLVKTAAPGQGTLTLQFSPQPLALSGVTILDRNGQTTALSLTGMNRDAPIDPSRFEYNAAQTGS